MTPFPSVETRTLESARRGDAAARQEILHLLQPRIRTTAARYARVTGMDRDDLQQEMWVGVVLGMEQVDRGVGDPLCYLYLRGKWRLLEAVRRSNRERTEPMEPDTEVVGPGSFEEEVLLLWQFRELAAKLPEPQRTILEGLQRGMQQDELARQMGCTPANVSYHLKKIRERFRALEADSPRPSPRTYTAA